MDTYMADEPIYGAVFLDKGGVGKTTSTAHLGVALAEDHDVLLIDLAGKQNDLSKHFGLWEEVSSDEDDAWPNISTVFSEEWGTISSKVPNAVDDMIYATDEEVDIIPAHKGLDQVDDELASVPAEQRYTFLDTFLTDYIDGYDVVLLDLPGLTNNITLNGLWATRTVVAPIELGPFEEKQMGALLADLEELESAFDVAVEVAMVLPNRVDSRTKIANELLQELRDAHPDTIASAAIPKSQDIKNAQREGKTVFALENPSGTAQRARDAFEDNAEELITRVNHV